MVLLKKSPTMQTQIKSSDGHETEVEENTEAPQKS